MLNTLVWRDGRAFACQAKGTGFESRQMWSRSCWRDLSNLSQFSVQHDQRRHSATFLPFRRRWSLGPGYFKHSLPCLWWTFLRVPLWCAHLRRMQGKSTEIVFVGLSCSSTAWDNTIPILLMSYSGPGLDSRRRLLVRFSDETVQVLTHTIRRARYRCCRYTYRSLPVY